MSNWRSFSPVLAVLLSPTSCERGTSGDNPAASTPLVAPAHASAPAPPASPAPPATSAPSASASSAPSLLMPVEPWLVGQWKGSTSTYAAVVNEHQTYTRTKVDMSIDPAGAVSVSVVRGNSETPSPSYWCKASGRLRTEGALQVMQLETSSCRLAKAGSEAQAQLQRVGKCLVQWNSREGRMPWDDPQIAFRKVGCRN